MDTPENNHNDQAEETSRGGEKWMMIAETSDRTQAEFAINGLESYGIPAVMNANPGVFGSAGLEMVSIYSGKKETFKIFVPVVFKEEAENLVKMFISGQSDSDEISEETGD